MRAMTVPASSGAMAAPSDDAVAGVDASAAQMGAEGASEPMLLDDTVVMTAAPDGLLMAVPAQGRAFRRA